MVIDKEKLIESIENTGFDLENYIYDVLKNNGWQVISNRYYVDDFKRIEREIDILAYKTKKDVNHIIYYTVLIISCKKTRDSTWAFMTRKKPESDPNIEYFFVENYTTDKRLAYMLQVKQQDIRADIIHNRNISTLFEFDHVPFAFQQVNLKTYKSEDDKRIYDSIITTIKALEYEKLNRGRPSIDGISSYFYNFNLLSILDGEMCEIFFNEGNKEICALQDTKYINRHIIGNKESFYKVHFITKEFFENQLLIYNDLHKENINIYPALLIDFYNEFFEDIGKVKIFWEDFCKSIKWSFNYCLVYKLKFKTKHETDKFDYDYKDKTLYLHFSGYDDIDEVEFLEKINDDDDLKKKTKKYLLQFFKYDGDFIFDNDYLPF